MRSFSDKEKIILNLFDVSNGVKFQNLFSGVIDDNKMIIDYKTNTVKIRYKTKGFAPDIEELIMITKLRNELFELIYQIVMLLNYMCILIHN